MIDGLFGIIAPHHCYGCGVTGTVLCDCCKNDIFEERNADKVTSGRTYASNTMCRPDAKPRQPTWCAAPRRGVLAEIIDAYKFQRVKAAHRPLAELLFESLPDLPGSTIIVPIPTAPRNVRVRGYDHMVLIARELSRLSGWKVSPLLQRTNNVTQHFTKTATERKRQAEKFFSIRKNPEPHRLYIIIDDIATTGATLDAAVHCLKSAGAKTVYTATIAKQI